MITKKLRENIRKQKKISLEKISESVKSFSLNLTETWHLDSDTEQKYVYTTI